MIDTTASDQGRHRACKCSERAQQHIVIDYKESLPMREKYNTKVLADLWIQR